MYLEMQLSVTVASELGSSNVPIKPELPGALRPPRPLLLSSSN